MDIWVRKCRSFEEEQEADREFWRQLAPSQRIAIVEDLRQREDSEEGERVSKDFEELLELLKLEGESNSDE